MRLNGFECPSDVGIHTHSPRRIYDRLHGATVPCGRFHAGEKISAMCVHQILKDTGPEQPKLFFRERQSAGNLNEPPAIFWLLGGQLENLT
jgi:hypothetical protein